MNCSMASKVLLMGAFALFLACGDENDTADDSTPLDLSGELSGNNGGGATETPEANPEPMNGVQGGAAGMGDGSSGSGSTPPNTGAA